MTAPRCGPSSSSSLRAPRRWRSTTRSSKRACRRRRQEIEELQQNLEAVRTESLTDPLTTLANRKYFDVELGRAIAEAKQKSEPLSLLMTDVDNFKAFNDKYGHLTGDQVLRLVAISVKQNVKARDIAARYGGEEFMVALPSTPLQHAITIADQIRHAVMTKELMKRSSGERLGRVTISIGVAALRPERYAAVAARARRRLPLRRQAPRPQPRDRREPIRRRCKPHFGRAWRSGSNSQRMPNAPQRRRLRAPARSAPIHRSRKPTSGSGC